MLSSAVTSQHRSVAAQVVVMLSSAVSSTQRSATVPGPDFGYGLYFHDVHTDRGYADLACSQVSGGLKLAKLKTPEKYNHALILIGSSPAWIAGWRTFDGYAWQDESLYASDVPWLGDYFTDNYEYYLNNYVLINPLGKGRVRAMTGVPGQSYGVLCEREACASRPAVSGGRGAVLAGLVPAQWGDGNSTLRASLRDATLIECAFWCFADSLCRAGIFQTDLATCILVGVFDTTREFVTMSGYSTFLREQFIN